jgi:hypothetical protein
VTPATLQQTRIASCEDVQKEARRLIEIIRACFADLYPDDDACGAGRGGAAPDSGGQGAPGAGARRHRRAPRRRPGESKADAAARVAAARARLAGLGRELLIWKSLGVGGWARALPAGPAPPAARFKGAS